MFLILPLHDTAFEIRGGKPLQGEIYPQGAKNEALQVLCAALLTDQPVTYTKVPDIIDVNLLLELLADMGVEVTGAGKGDPRSQRNQSRIFRRADF